MRDAQLVPSFPPEPPTWTLYLTLRDGRRGDIGRYLLCLGAARTKVRSRRLDGHTLTRRRHVPAKTRSEKSFTFSVHCGSRLTRDGRLRRTCISLIGLLSARVGIERNRKLED